MEIVTDHLVLALALALALARGGKITKASSFNKLEKAILGRPCQTPHPIPTTVISA